MTTTWTRVSDAPLYEEHLLLGGTFAQDEPFLATPVSYGGEAAAPVGEREGCVLADLSGMAMLLASGASCEDFVAASCAGRALAVGEVAFSAVLTGDGSLAGAPLVARTGDAEYLVCDPLERGLMLMPWLSFLASIEQDGFRPYEGVEVEDVSGALVPLLVWGPQAPAVLGDYVASLDDLPAASEVRNVRLDRIECLVLRPEVDDDPCYLLLVPPVAARALWRSLLSFPVVEPVGTERLACLAGAGLPWLDALRSDERAPLGLAALIAHGLARAADGFVGARALGR